MVWEEPGPRCHSSVVVLQDPVQALYERSSHPPPACCVVLVNPQLFCVVLALQNCTGLTVHVTSHIRMEAKESHVGVLMRAVSSTRFTMSYEENL